MTFATARFERRISFKSQGRYKKEGKPEIRWQGLIVENLQVQHQRDDTETTQHTVHDERCTL